MSQLMYKNYFPLICGRLPQSGRWEREVVLFESPWLKLRHKQGRISRWGYLLKKDKMEKVRAREIVTTPCSFFGGGGERRDILGCCLQPEMSRVMCALQSWYSPRLLLCSWFIHCSSFWPTLLSHFMTSRPDCKIFFPYVQSKLTICHYCHLWIPTGLFLCLILIPFVCWKATRSP